MPALLLIVLPLLEIAGFILVGQAIGVLPTIGLVLATSLLGAVMLRVQGLGVLARIRAESAAGALPGREVAEGATILLAAFLLFLPGFLTDIVGLLLFIPALRHAAWRFFGRRITIVGSRFGDRRGAAARPAPRARTIDLNPEEFSRAEDRDGSSQSPWRRRDRE